MPSLRDQLQSTLGNAYTLERELGGGGMSRVFVADESRLERKVAVKVLSPDLAQGLNAERFLREIKVAASLQQANIVPVLTAGDVDGLPYYTMPFVDGESLRIRMGRGPLAIGESIGILRDVAKALAYAHARGIVHRDIKPDNVLLSGGTAVVTDFGIAKAISAAKTNEGGLTLTQIGTSIGTPMYMAPEQAAGDPDVDHRADIYSFACMAYEMLGGRPPFSAKTPQRLLAAHMGEKPQDVAELRVDIPATLTELVMRCLAKNPDDRPQSVADMLPVLESTTSGSDRPPAPALLLGGKGMLRKALVSYVVAFAAVVVVTRAAIIALGLPDWVFPGAMIVMALGLPAILFTAYAQRVTRRAFTSTPTFTPGGTPSLAHGTMATIALKASPHLSWRRTAQWGVYAASGFVVLVAAAMLLRAAGVGPFATLLSAGTLKGGDQILVAEFAAPAASDASLGRTIAEAVKADLGASSAVGVVSDAEVTSTLAQMRRPDAAMLLPVAQDVAQRRGVRAIVDGNLTTAGQGFIVTIRLVTADSARVLASYTDAADGPSQLIEVVGRLTKKLRAKMGESLKKVRASPPLAEATTSSLAALQKYSAAREALYRRADRPAFVRLLREAIALDTSFVAAYASLGVELNNRGGVGQEVGRLLTRAFEGRARVSQRERLNIEYFFYRFGPAETRDFARASAALDTMADLARNASGAAGGVGLGNAALLARDRGDFARAESLFRRAIESDTVSSYSLGNFASMLAGLGRMRESDSTFAIYQRRFPASAVISTAMRQTSAGDRAGGERALRVHYDSVKADPFARAGVAQALADLSARWGKLGDAARWREAVLDAQRARGIMRGGVSVAARGAEIRVVAQSDTAGAARMLEQALRLTPLDSIAVAERPHFDLTVAWAAAGRPDRARIALAAMEQQERDDDPARASLLAEARAAVAMAERRWDDAIRAVQTAPPGRCGYCIHRSRGLAFDGAGQRDSAIVSYERFVSAGFASSASVTVTFRRLGELYEAKGDLTKAIANYRRFVDEWKDADPELQPQVADVRQRIARLQQQERRGR